ncbi:hypothetical protein EYR38_006368 [Pleurotus pulmonarius]|nr:hypothetical protein EYR38_006368 [Pleurotus pulmonarius]
MNGQFYTSAITPTRGTSLRQRASASGSTTPSKRPSWPDDDWGAELGGRPPHTRASTEGIPHDWNNGRHPLQSADVVMNSDRAGTTRPHLARLSDWKDKKGDDEPHPPTPRDRYLSGSQDDMEEKEVIVHEVTSSDSLAGVALKYGISLANLRKANHLWASDSIHIRKVLYIPLEMLPTQAAAPYRAMLREMNREQESDSEWTSTIRRIPASRLSFFPPSSHSMDTQPQPIPPYNNHNNNIGHHARSSTAPSASLTTLLTALPIAASTRDTIIARLSFDSSRNSSVSDDHEMDSIFAPAPDPAKTPKAQYQEPSVAKGKGRTSPPPSPTRDRSAMRRSTSHRSGHEVAQEAGYDLAAKVHLTVSESRPAIIRTAQMEPSPSMQLPNLSRSRGRIKTDDDHELW